MILSELSMAILFIGAVAYIVLLILLLINRGVQETLVRYLVIYILISFSLDLIRVLMQSSLFDLNVKKILFAFTVIVLVGNTVLLLKICSYLLPVKSDNRFWLISGALWALILFFWIAGNYDYFINKPGSELSRPIPDMIFNGLAVLGWAILLSRMVYLTYNSYRLIKRPLHKNRLTFWTTSLLFIVIGDVFSFRDVNVLGSPLHLMGVGAIVYIILTHNLVDIFRTSLQSLRYLITTFFALLVYAILILLLLPIIQERPGYNALVGAMILAAVLAFTVNPVVDHVSKRINKSLLGMDYDPNTVMREYIQSISNIVELQLLEQISMNLIKNTFGVDVGHLYIVEEIDDVDRSIFRLSDAGEDEESGYLKYDLQNDDPIARRFSEDHLPLTQYDLDYHPLYRQRALSGGRKFLSQEMEVYVPIHQNNRWIGLFALGPKTSGDRYYDEELMLLETLADQSAVALENAKLFTRLQQMNKEVTQAREELQRANIRLQEIDQLKSAFISVITHEMRTPLANLAFAMQIFEMYGLENFSDEQKIQLEELRQSMKAARRMVDDLVTFASFLNDQAEIKIDEFDIRDIVMHALKPHQAIAQDKGVNLKLDVIGKNFVSRGDSKLLTNAVFNLINNAVKFTNDGGAVVVSCWVKEGELVINVKDNGIGIQPSRMENIWDAFVSTTNPLHRGWEGLGLGLALVKLIVEAHGGNVWAQSEPGKGSDFGFQIPNVVQPVTVYPFEISASES